MRYLMTIRGGRTVTKAEVTIKADSPSDAASKADQVLDGLAVIDAGVYLDEMTELA